MPSPSKNKGNAWEREVANYLGKIYDLSFVRTPGSGAYVGGKNVVRKDTLDASQQKGFKGDIIPPETWSHFNAEAKSYADFPFHQLFSGNVKQLEGWIEQCMDVADPGDFNILFIKLTRKGKYVAVQNDPSNTKLIFSKSFHYGSLNHGTWTIMDFQSFFETNSEQVRQLCSTAP